jgi:hypothetical protein
MTGKKVHINYLCHQPFWNFKKQGTNDFCKHCNHQIHDFTHSTPEEIIRVLEQNNGKTCGRFYSDQFKEDARTKHSPAAYKIALASLISFFAFTKLEAQSSATDSVKTEQHANPLFQNSPSDPVVVEKGNAVNTCPVGGAPEIITPPRKRRYYVSSRFPFIHKKRTYMMTGDISF